MKCAPIELYLSYIVFYIGFLDIASCQGWVIADDGCRTPDMGVGDCIPIKQCKPMISFLANLPGPPSDRTRHKLNEYTCSYEDGTVYVCCPYGPIVIADETDTPKPVTDIRKHRYFGLLPKNCGYLGDLGDKIKHGQNASLNEFPWMALLNYKSNKVPNFKCGATIINERWILTAAHCITKLKQPLLSVRVGEHDIKTVTDCELKENGETKCAPPVQDVAIEKIIPHPDFNLDVIDNDIGLIKVSRMNIQKENSRPVCLPTDPSMTPEEFQDGVVTGWGVTETGLASDILQKVSLPLVDMTTCKSVYKSQPNARITEKQLCAGGKDDKDSCPGDSGGPLQVATFLNDETRYVQMGIVSFGPKYCGLSGYPGVYSNVAYYMDWILNTLGEN